MPLELKAVIFSIITFSPTKLPDVFTFALKVAAPFTCSLLEPSSVVVPISTFPPDVILALSFASLVLKIKCL